MFIFYGSSVYFFPSKPVGMCFFEIIVFQKAINILKPNNVAFTLTIPTAVCCGIN